jgi:hypothetical protein
MPYNPWYEATYEAICEMPHWHRLDQEVPMKMVCVFSWMPQTIMSVNHTGRVPKWTEFGLAAVESRLRQAAPLVADVRNLRLEEAVLAEREASLLALFQLLFLPLGSVAASKLLHFSVPRFFPMWDRGIRLGRGHKDNANGYFEYMAHFQHDLLHQENLEQAVAAYPANPVRGWDIVNMRRRDG